MNKSILPEKLKEINTLLFDKCDFLITNCIEEKESSEYDAFRFEINGIKILYRLAKITPTKIGQFVTFWKRLNTGIIAPLDSNDDIDLFVINVKSENNFGQFVFSKKILIEKGILTHGSKNGKLAARVYPKWDKTENKQAIKTQQWQLNYFIKISENETLDIERVKKMYQII